MKLTDAGVVFIQKRIEMFLFLRTFKKKRGQLFHNERLYIPMKYWRNPSAYEQYTYRTIRNSLSVREYNNRKRRLQAGLYS